MASLSPGPNLNRLETREAPSRRRPSGPFLWSDWEKLTTLPLSGERRHPALTRHPLQKVLADVNLADVNLKWGAVKTPSFHNFPRSGSAAPLGTTVSSCVCLVFASSSAVAGPAPRTSPPPLRSCGKSGFASGSRRDRMLYSWALHFGPRQPCWHHCSLG